MKIRFTSPRSAPDVDNGIKVPYAPPKRQAFRLRWYLILLLVSSPLLYMGWRALTGLWLIEAPGYIERPTIQLNAPQAALVGKIAVRENQPVRQGEPLIELHRTELDQQRQTLRQHLDQPSTPPPPAADAGQLALLRESLARYQRLFDAGAATRGELDAARLRLREAQAALRAQPSGADERERRNWQIELDGVERMRQSLLLLAPADATVLTLETRPGLSVQAGQTLLTLQENTAPRVVALLPPSYARYARAGQPAKVVWSSGETAQARVLFNGTLSERIPEVLREFGGTRQGILVHLELLAPLPEQLKVNNLAVSVRFSRQLLN